MARRRSQTVIYGEVGRQVSSSNKPGAGETRAYGEGARNPLDVIDVTRIAAKSHITEEQAGQLLASGKAELHRMGTVLFMQGTDPDFVYVILSGSVRLEKDGIPFAELSKGEIFGERAVLFGAKHAATARATSRVILQRFAAGKLVLLLQRKHTGPALLRNYVLRIEANEARLAAHTRKIIELDRQLREAREVKPVPQGIEANLNATAARLRELVARVGKLEAENTVLQRLVDAASSRSSSSGLNNSLMNAQIQLQQEMDRANREKGRVLSILENARGIIQTWRVHRPFVYWIVRWIAGPLVRELEDTLEPKPQLPSETE